MAMSSEQRKAVDGLFRAMQAGPAGEEAMMALFAEKAVWLNRFPARCRYILVYRRFARASATNGKTRCQISN